jgi:spermidine synthase
VTSRASPRTFCLLLFLFAASGCAALIYEIVWFQMLQLVVGSSAISLAVLLGTFMGGMCLGSLALPRFIRASFHPLRVYGLLELGIGLAGLVVLVAVPAISRLYVSLVGHGMPGIVLRAAVCVVCLLPPTVLMGATLPAIARWVESTPRGMSWLGLFYGGNTIGAVVGCVLAGFYLLRVHDSVTATYCAVLLNAAVALIAFALARNSAYSQPAQSDAPGSRENTDSTGASVATRGSNQLIMIAIALSGFCALAAEVVWARILSLLLGATVYTFSIILAVFLAGLGLGSSVGAAIACSTSQPRLALACCQFLQVGAIAWAAHAIAVTLPYWPVDESLAAIPAAKFRFDLVRCAWAILPSAVLWGASFPLALAGIAAPGQDASRLVGRAYAANTLGAIGGAVLGSMVLIPALGTQLTQVVLIAMSVIAAALAFPLRGARPLAGAVALVAAAVLLARGVPEIPWQLVAYGRQIASTDYGAHKIYFGEGMNSSVAVSETPGGARFFPFD